MAMAALAEEAELQAESLSRRAAFALRISKYVRTAVLVLFVPMAVLWLFFPTYTQILIIIGLQAVVAVGMTVYGILYRQGRVFAGMYVFLGSLLLAFVPAYLMQAELRPAVIMAYVVLLMMSKLFLGDQRSRPMNAIAVLTLVLNVFLAQRGWVPYLPPPAPTVATLMSILFTAFVAVVATVVVRIIVTGQEEFYLEAARANREIGRREAAERETRKQLQETVEQYASYTAEVGQGRLNRRLPLVADESSPLAALGLNLNDTVTNLQQMTQQLRETAQGLSSAAGEILAASRQQVNGASEQSAAVSQASASIHEVQAIAEQTSERAHGVAELARRTAEVSETGQQAVAEAVVGMREVQEKVDTIAQHILALSEQAQAIGQIIATVSEIAAQSNMLALNAAVEAARAGEAGKGFAVVAGEVRALAEQSRAATVQVKEILTEIQRGVNAAVMATEEGIKRAHAGTGLAGEAGLAIQELAGGVQGSAQAAVQIAAAAGQQQTGLQQVAQAIQQIHAVAAQTVDSTRQTERAAEELSRMAGKLEELVARYKL